MNDFESVVAIYYPGWKFCRPADWLKANPLIPNPQQGQGRPFTSDSTKKIWAGENLRKTNLNEVKTGLDELIAHPEMEVKESNLYRIFSNIVDDLNDLEGVNETRETAYLFGSFTNKYFKVSKGSLEEKKAAQACLTTLGQIVVGDRHGKDTTKAQDILKLQLTQAKIAKIMKHFVSSSKEYNDLSSTLQELKVKTTSFRSDNTSILPDDLGEIGEKVSQLTIEIQNTILGKIEKSDFNSQLQEIKTKEDTIKQNGPSKVANELHTTIINELKSLREKQNIDFIDNCMCAINKARPELQKHRGWTPLLDTLVLAVTILGLALILFNLVINQRFTSFHKTDSATKIDQLEQSIQSFKP